MQIKAANYTRGNGATPPDRRQFIGGSDARIIMSPDEAALIRLWKEKRGEAEPEDLSDNLVIQLGLATEALNRSWYERNTKRAVTDVQRWVQHPVRRYMAATLDGFITDFDAVFEAKFMLPWSFSQEAAAEKHMAQLQHNKRSPPLEAHSITSPQRSPSSSMRRRRTEPRLAGALRPRLPRDRRRIGGEGLHRLSPLYRRGRLISATYSPSVRNLEAIWVRFAKTDVRCQS